MVRYELPRLPYGYGELEPYIDEQTMRIHHLEHHRYYVDGLNASLGQISAASHPRYITSILSDPGSVPRQARDAVNFFGGGFENHRMFWETLAPGGGGGPGGRLGDAIDVYFGSFENLKARFSLRAASVEGSGWCWLVFDRTYDRIEVIATANQDSPWAAKKVPLLGLDVWEHAYYLQYLDRRPDYVESWWNVVNWDYAENRFAECTAH